MDTRGAIIEILGVQARNGVFTKWDNNGKPAGTAAMP
jgi:hypothetical protein